MDLFTLITLLIVVSAAFAYLNTRLLRLPDAIGIMVVALTFSLAFLGLHAFDEQLFSVVRRTVGGIEFDRVLFEVMLSLLLFAGAFHTDAARLRVERHSVILFAVGGTLLSTALIGAGLYGLSHLLEPAPPLSWPVCLLFGALISPTDPIAVLGILARFKLPENVKLNIVGESLFNDGVGVVVFASIYELVVQGPEAFSLAGIAKLFVIEAGGGIVFGLALGYVLYRLLRSINHYQTEVLLTLAAVLGGNLLAQRLHISGPLAMVVAGLFVGDRARQDAMSQQTEEYVDKFWELLDGILNALLFVLIGVELLVVKFHSSYWLLCGAAIVLVLAARFVAIWLPYRLTRRWLTLDDKAPIMMTWGGLRGGISVALALSISNAVPEKNVVVAITYAVVVFSVIVQGLTLEKLIKRLYRPERETPAH